MSYNIFRLSPIHLLHCINLSEYDRRANIKTALFALVFPWMISRTAGKDKGVATANTAGITLVCFSRNDRFTIYTHPKRVLGIGLQQHK